MQQEKEERRISMLLIDIDFGRSEDIDKHHFDQEVLDKKNELLNDQWWGAC